MAQFTDISKDCGIHIGLFRDLIEDKKITLACQNYATIRGNLLMSTGALSTMKLKVLLFFWQMDYEHASHPKAAFYGDIATVGLGNVFYDGKAQSGAAHIPTSGLVHPVKSFKQPGEVFFSDSDALIGDSNL